MNPIIMGELAKEALLTSLNVTPKPGLVDKEGTGAHTDLSYELMKKAIEAVAPHFVTFGQTGLFTPEATEEQVSHIMEEVGKAAMAEMYAATGGVNALKGSIFAIGLFITAYYRLFRQGVTPSADNMPQAIAGLAQHIRRAKDTHGAWISESYQVEGALGEAQSGYVKLLAEELWLYRSMEGADREIRIFLHIMSTLKDSCVYYRAGADLADDVRTIAAHLYNNYNPDDVRTACRYFERCHLSTGGSGDMLALLLLADKVL